MVYKSFKNLIMKALKYTFLTMLFGCVTASCNFLDKDPYQIPQSDYFNTAAEASSFLTGIYAELGQSTFYGADYMYLVGGDDLAHYGGSGRAPATKGLICNNATTSDAAVTGFWYTLYSGINRANIFLENVDKVTDFTSELKAQYIAEARFLRAFYYFNLVQCWGDVPFKTESTKDVVGLNIPRTDKEEIYDFIIKEMQEVSDENEGGLLTAAKLNYKPGRVSKSAAWGILARVYLFRAGEYHRENKVPDAERREKIKSYYQGAKDYALKVCTNQGHGLADDYWDYFIDLCSDRYNTTANESIWEAEFSGNNTSDVKAEGRIGNIIGLAAPDMSSKSEVVGSADPGYAYEFIFATPKLYRLYCIGEPSDENLMNIHVNFNSGTTAEKQEGEAYFNYKVKDERFLWNIAPFIYMEKDGKNTGVTGRKFYEKGFRDLVLAHDNKRSYSYGKKEWASGETEPKEGDYDYSSNFTTNIARACAKFRREYEADKKDKNNTAINFPILRYSDVLLMLSEAENELNGATKTAYDALNEVRKRAGVSDAPAGLSQDGFRQMVKDERARELCFEYTRRFDLIRWGEFETNMKALVNNARAGGEWNQGPSNVYTYFDISSTYNYFPIPDAEMAVNKAITTNNPGW